MSVLSDKLQDVFMNIHNKFVDVNSRTDELFDAKADRSELPTKVSQLENDKNYVTPEETESFVHSDTLASDYYNANYIDNIVNEVSSAIGNIKETKADKEVWEKLVDVTLTENLTDEFRQVFDKPYKKIRFKIKFVGDSTMALTQVRFKRCKTDGNNSHYNYNYLKYTSASNLSVARIIAGTVEFDIDNFIVIKNSSITTSSSMFGANGDTYRSDGFYSEEMQTFPEFYMYLGTNVIGVGSKIEVWGCN